MNTVMLEPKLKALHLHGMLQTLENRLGQVRDSQLGHLEFLELLLEDEVARRQTRSLQARITQAHFADVTTLAAFDFAFNPTIPAGQLRDLATCRYLERKESIILCGAVGLGKSHLAQALGWEACTRGYTVLFTTTARMLQDLGAGHLDGSWPQRLRRYLRPQLLILDDFAMRDFTGQQSEDLYELVGERVRSGSTITTGNRAPTDWYPLFPNPVLAEGILDRLVNAAHQITLSGRSYRPQLRPDRDPTGARLALAGDPVHDVAAQPTPEGTRPRTGPGRGAR